MNFSQLLKTFIFIFGLTSLHAIDINTDPLTSSIMSSDLVRVKGLINYTKLEPQEKIAYIDLAEQIIIQQRIKLNNYPYIYSVYPTISGALATASIAIQLEQGWRITWAPALIFSFYTLLFKYQEYMLNQISA